MRPHCGLRTGAQQASDPPSALGHVGERSEPTRALPVAATQHRVGVSASIDASGEAGQLRRAQRADTGKAGPATAAGQRSSIGARPRRRAERADTGAASRRNAASSRRVGQHRRERRGWPASASAASRHGEGRTRHERRRQARAARALFSGLFRARRLYISLFIKSPSRLAICLPRPPPPAPGSPRTGCAAAPPRPV